VTVTIRFVTKWALSQGILRIDGELYQPRPEDSVYFTFKSGSLSVLVRDGVYAFATEAKAVANVARQLGKKRKSLLAQLRKFESGEAGRKALTISEVNRSA
jgi:hypothetical protein